jgi:hypothetical protein
MAINSELLDQLYSSLPPLPAETARVNSLCVRPGPNLREERAVIEFHPERGAIGDRWEHKTWLYLPDGKPDPRVQVAICNSKILALIQKATGVLHHPGDTIFTDLDLSIQNLPDGARLRVGQAIIEVSDVENDACGKFAAHYGVPVLQWIRLPHNRPFRLRGLYAKIVSGGTVCVDDLISKL